MRRDRVLVDVVKAAECLGYTAAAQGVRRFRNRVEGGADGKRFVRELVGEVSERQ